MIEVAIAIVAAIFGVIGYGLIERRSGRRSAETSYKLAEHQQAKKGRQAAAEERERTDGFDPQHLTDAIDERTDAWRAR